MIWTKQGSKIAKLEYKQIHQPFSFDCLIIGPILPTPNGPCFALEVSPYDRVANPNPDNFSNL